MQTGGLSTPGGARSFPRASERKIHDKLSQRSPLVPGSLRDVSAIQGAQVRPRSKRSDHDLRWRDPAEVASQWEDASQVDPALLRFVVRGKWWEILESCRMVLLITREYEHLILSVSVTNGNPRVSYFPLPHPSGLVADRLKNVVHVASTRNPNQVFDFMPADGRMSRLDVKGPES